MDVLYLCLHTIFHTANIQVIYLSSFVTLFSCYGGKDFAMVALLAKMLPMEMKMFHT